MLWIKEFLLLLTLFGNVVCIWCKCLFCVKSNLPFKPLPQSSRPKHTWRPDSCSAAAQVELHPCSLLVLCSFQMRLFVLTKCVCVCVPVFQVWEDRLSRSPETSCGLVWRDSGLWRPHQCRESVGQLWPLPRGECVSVCVHDKEDSRPKLIKGVN